MTYATDRLFEEVAYVAYHFHWPIEDPRPRASARRRFVEEIGQINRRAQEALTNDGPPFAVATDRRIGDGRRTWRRLRGRRAGTPDATVAARVA